MVQMIAMPNGLLSFEVFKGTINSIEYIKLLSEKVVPIIKLNYADIWQLQEDNSPVHKSRKVQNFMKNPRIFVIKWPTKILDLNIVKDCWKTISDLVYDGYEFQNKAEYSEKITNVIFNLNQGQRKKVLKLYNAMRCGLYIVLKKYGDLYNRYVILINLYLY